MLARRGRELGVAAVEPPLQRQPHEQLPLQQHAEHLQLEALEVDGRDTAAARPPIPAGDDRAPPPPLPTIWVWVWVWVIGQPRADAPRDG
jgi:hypothetical protein